MVLLIFLQKDFKIPGHFLYPQLNCILKMIFLSKTTD